MFSVGGMARRFKYEDMYLYPVAFQSLANPNCPLFVRYRIMELRHSFARREPTTTLFLLLLG